VGASAAARCKIQPLADLLGVSRQAMPNDLACLRGCGMVVAVSEGPRARYGLADQRRAQAFGDLLGKVLAVDPAVCADAESRGCWPPSTSITSTTCTPGPSPPASAWSRGRPRLCACPPSATGARVDQVSQWMTAGP